MQRTEDTNTTKVSHAGCKARRRRYGRSRELLHVSVTIAVGAVVGAVVVVRLMLSNAIAATAVVGRKARRS